MDVFFLFRSIHRLFVRPARNAAPARPTARPTARPVAPRPVVAMQASPAESVQASGRKMRTLEEVRADLARLRLSASERHARSQAFRDTNFAPTDFMELAKN